MNQIEECIEEVTTRYSSDDEDEPKSELDKFLSSLKYIKHQRAPFPELGKDIIDGKYHILYVLYIYFRLLPYIVN